MHGINVVGRWKLISAKAENSNGDITYPYGEDAFGILMYDTNGYMYALLMRHGRSKFVSGDPFGGTSEELKEAFEGFEAYCGTYELDIENGEVTHHVEGARFPNWEGTDQKRFFELSDDRLVIKSAPIPALGTEWVVSLVWDRAA
jgi:hypothetical protein